MLPQNFILCLEGLASKRKWCSLLDKCLNTRPAFITKVNLIYAVGSKIFCSGRGARSWIWCWQNGFALRPHFYTARSAGQKGCVNMQQLRGWSGTPNGPIRAQQVTPSSSVVDKTEARLALASVQLYIAVAVMNVPLRWIINQLHTAKRSLFIAGHCK
jgi:hypothetical protein